MEKLHIESEDFKAFVSKRNNKDLHQRQSKPTRKIIVSSLIALLTVSAMFQLSMALKPNSMLTVPPSVEAIYEGDLIISGNKNQTIANRNFVIRGSIIIRENATLFVRNSVINFLQAKPNQFNITLENPVNGQPRLQVKNGTLISEFALDAYLYENSLLTATKLNATLGWFHFMNSSQATINTSTLKNLNITASSTVSITDSTIDKLSTSGTAKATILDVRATELNIFESAKASVNSSNTVNMKVSGSSEVSISSLSAVELSVSGSSNVIISNSELPSIKVKESSIVTLSGITVKGLTEALESSKLLMTNSTTKRLSVSGSSEITMSDSQTSELRTMGTAKATIISSQVTMGTGLAHLILGESSTANVSNSQIDTVAVTDVAQISLFNTTINSWLNTYDSSVAFLSDSTVKTSIFASNSSSISVHNSKLSIIEGSETSSLQISNTIVTFVQVQDYSQVSFSDSTIQEMRILSDSVNCSITDLAPGNFDQWSFNLGGVAPKATLTNTQIQQSIGFVFLGSSNVTILNSELQYLGLSGSAVADSVNSTLTLDFVTGNARMSSYWYLQIQVVDPVGNPVSGATVTIEHANGTDIFSGVTDATGKIALEFPLLAAVKNGTGSFSVDYVLGAKLDNYSTEQLAGITGPKITLTLPLPLPWWQQYWYIIVLVVAVAIAGATAFTLTRRTQKKKAIQ